MARHDYIAQDVATKGNNKKVSGWPRIIKTHGSLIIKTKGNVTGKVLIITKRTDNNKNNKD